MSPSEAEDHMRATKAHAQMHLQLDLAAAAKLPMPQHAVSVKRAHRLYCLRMAAGADATIGADGTRIIDSSFYDRSAQEYE
jgi:hypothetical protein